MKFLYLLCFDYIINFIWNAYLINHLLERIIFILYLKWQPYVVRMMVSSRDFRLLNQFLFLVLFFFSSSSYVCVFLFGNYPSIRYHFYPISPILLLYIFFFVRSFIFIFISSDFLFFYYRSWRRLCNLSFNDISIFIYLCFFFSSSCSSSSL